MAAPSAAPGGPPHRQPSPAPLTTSGDGGSSEPLSSARSAPSARRWTQLGTQKGFRHAAIQLSGGTGFPEDPQWLFNQDWYTPGYAPTPGLASLLPLAAPAGPDLYWLVSYAVVFAYTLGLVATTVDGLDPRVLLGERSEVGVAAGFHDGDIALAGVLSPSGLDRSELGWAG